MLLAEQISYVTPTNQIFLHRAFSLRENQLPLFEGILPHPKCAHTMYDRHRPALASAVKHPSQSNRGVGSEQQQSRSAEFGHGSDVELVSGSLQPSRESIRVAFPHITAAAKPGPEVESPNIVNLLDNR